MEIAQNPQKTPKFERDCLYRGPQNRRTPLPTPPKFIFSDPDFDVFDRHPNAPPPKIHNNNQQR